MAKQLLLMVIKLMAMESRHFFVGFTTTLDGPGGVQDCKEDGVGFKGFPMSVAEREMDWLIYVQSVKTVEKKAWLMDLRLD